MRAHLVWVKHSRCMALQVYREQFLLHASTEVHSCWDLVNVSGRMLVYAFNTIYFGIWGFWPAEVSSSFRKDNMYQLLIMIFSVFSVWSSVQSDVITVRAFVWNVILPQLSFFQGWLNVTQRANMLKYLQSMKTHMRLYTDKVLTAVCSALP